MKGGVNLRKRRQTEKAQSGQRGRKRYNRLLLRTNASLKINSTLKSFVSFNLLRGFYRPIKYDMYAMKHVANGSDKDGTGSSSVSWIQIRLDRLAV